MSNPVQEPDKFQLISLLPTLMGGFLSIAGGFGAVVLRSRTEKKNEINYIKISLTDELEAVCSIVDKLNETYSKTHIVSNTYLNDLATNSESFNYHKQRIFLISDEALRRDIVSFYKNLSDIIADSINKVGSLGEAQVDNTHDQIVGKFTDIKTKATSLKTVLKSYRFKVFWLFG